jgi:hypothetical protein
VKRRRGLIVGLIVATFCTIWCAKLGEIGRYGTDVPYWDQWAKEGEMIYAPWFERHEFWKNIFVPHNEHRMAATLALNLGLVRLAGDQWDARVQCAVNAALHALLAVGLVGLVFRRFGVRWGAGTALLVTLICAPPIAWENVFGGFQSCFYFLAGFSLLALYLLSDLRLRPGRAVLGLAAGGLALVSMGSGLLISAPLAVIAILRLVEFRRTSPVRNSALVELAAALAIGGAGVWLHTAAPWHDSIHAHSLRELFVYAVRCLAWPLYTAPWLSVALWAPWLVLLVARVRWFGRASVDAERRRLADFVLGAGVWIVLQALAVGYSRAGASPYPAARYGDVFALGLVLNFLALALLLGPPARDALRPSPARYSLPLGWLALTAVVVVIGARGVVPDVQQKHRDNLGYERNVHAFVLTDDYAALEKASPLPFPMADWLARILRNPTLRRLLPSSVRAPIPVPGLADDRGVDSVIPPLEHRATRAVTVTDHEWRSAVIAGGRGWWKIETAGDIGQPGTILELVAAGWGKRLSTVAPTKPADRGWRAAYIPAPREPAFLRASVSAPAHAIGVSEPVYVSTVSFRTWRLTQNAGWLDGIALALGTLCGAALLYRPRRLW